MTTLVVVIPSTFVKPLPIKGSHLFLRSLLMLNSLQTYRFARGDFLYLLTPIRLVPLRVSIRSGGVVDEKQRGAFPPFA